MSKPEKVEAEASREVTTTQHTTEPPGSGIGGNRNPTFSGGEVGLERGKQVDNQSKKDLDLPVPSSAPAAE